MTPAPKNQCQKPRMLQHVPHLHDHQTGLPYQQKLLHLLLQLHWCEGQQFFGVIDAITQSSPPEQMPLIN